MDFSYFNLDFVTELIAQEELIKDIIKYQSVKADDLIQTFPSELLPERAVRWKGVSDEIYDILPTTYVEYRNKNSTAIKIPRVEFLLCEIIIESTSIINKVEIVCNGNLLRLYQPNLNTWKYKFPYNGFPLSLCAWSDIRLGITAVNSDVKLYYKRLNNEAHKDLMYSNYDLLYFDNYTETISGGTWVSSYRSSLISAPNDIIGIILDSVDFTEEHKLNAVSKLGKSTNSDIIYRHTLGYERKKKYIALKLLRNFLKRAYTPPDGVMVQKRLNEMVDEGLVEN